MSKFSNNGISSNCLSVRTKIQRFPKKLKFLSLRLTGSSCATTEIRDVCRLKPHLHYGKKWVQTHRKVGTDQIFFRCKPSVPCLHEMDPDSLFSGFGAIGGYARLRLCTMHFSIISLTCLLPGFFLQCKMRLKAKAFFNFERRTSTGSEAFSL